MEAFLRESGFPIFGGKFLCREFEVSVFGRHFVTVHLIFDFLLYFGCFGLIYQ